MHAPRRSFTGFSSRGRSFQTFSISNIGLAKSKVAPSKLVCVQLVAPCNSLASFCAAGECRYSIFSTGDACCPVGDALFP